MTQEGKGEGKYFWIPDQAGNDIKKPDPPYRACPRPRSGRGQAPAGIRGRLIKAGTTTLHDGMGKQRVKENPDVSSFTLCSLCLFYLYSTDLEFGNFRNRVKRGVGQDIHRRFPEMEVHKDCSARHALRYLRLYLKGAAPR